MKKLGILFYPIVLFILSQAAWFSLLGLWIYWYATNYLLLSEVEKKLPLTELTDTTNVAILVGGIILMVMLSVSMSFIFIYYTRQRNLNRMYDNFIANVTHELKSPLSSIQLYLETLRQRNVPNARQKNFFNLMLDDVGRLNRLINSILYLSSIEERKLARKVAHDYHIYNADMVIRQIIDEAYTDFNLSIDDLSIEGRISGECVIDQNWLKIVFSNLIDNAIKYSREPLKINIKLWSEIKYFYVEFTDNGIGILLRNQKKIFNKFQRLYNPKNPSVKGTGLGLYWVKEIVEYHGGKISVKSAGIDQGTTFKIGLPIYQTSKKRYINRLLKLSRKEKQNSDEKNEQ
jgi:signal transduction histidine kinase